MGRHIANIYRLGIKELWSLARDPMMLILIGVSFTIMIYTAATAVPESLHNAPIAVVDEDSSPMSQRIVSAFYPPHFTPPAHVSAAEADAGMDRGLYTFWINIPPNFQRDVLAGRPAEIQLNIDATRMSQRSPAAATSSRSSATRSTPSSSATVRPIPRPWIWRYACALIPISPRPGSAP